MKRRHESTVDSIPRPQTEGTENVPRHIFKKRRTINNDNSAGLGRRRSLRDINNLSGHPGSAPYDESTTLKITQSNTHRGSPINSVKEIVPMPNISSPELNTPVHGSRFEQQPTSTNSRPLAPVPCQQTTVSEPTSSPLPGISRSALAPSLPRFVSQDKPVRISQSRIAGEIRSSDQSAPLDSDQEDESGDSDGESEDGGIGTGTERVDSDEKQRVESNYSEINRLLGDLFLSRHRNRT